MERLNGKEVIDCTHKINPETFTFIGVGSSGNYDRPSPQAAAGGPESINVPMRETVFTSWPICDTRTRSKLDPEHDKRTFYFIYSFSHRVPHHPHHLNIYLNHPLGKKKPQPRASGVSQSASSGWPATSARTLTRLRTGSSVPVPPRT